MDARLPYGRESLMELVAVDESFRAEVRDYLEDLLSGEFRGLRGLGGTGSQHEAFDERLAWERRLARDGWVCIGWPEEHGGRNLPLIRQVIFHEEYARADAPARVGLIGEGLLGPTLMAFGTPRQQQRFLPPIRRGEELWCQGYSEPDAGSDLANVKTVAERDGGDWVVTGQKVWTSLATWADWCFLLCRTAPATASSNDPSRAGPPRKHRGLSYLLVPMKQDGIEVRPIVQITGTSEFNAIFFDRARTDAPNVVGEVGGGWRVAMGTLEFERGVFTLGQEIGFARELGRVIELGRDHGATADPVMRQRISNAWIGLRIIRMNGLRTLTSLARGTQPGPSASITKLVWSVWHQRLGELAMDAAGGHAMLAGDGHGEGYPLSPLQRTFLFSRADTIYAGSSEIQRNVIAERALGLPREPSLG
jgi:alkylation response protein AidB-like acyl-CoA dehydrogenase